MATSTTTTLKMKLVIDTKKNRVLFAEANKDVVDFLLFLLAHPFGSIVKILEKEFMCGSVGNLYAFVDLLCSLPSVEKKDLRPKVMPSAASTSRSPLLLPVPSSGSQTKNFFSCINKYNTDCQNYVTDSSGANCPSCGSKMSSALKYVAPASPAAVSGYVPSSSGAAKGFVQGQGVVTYTVRDDLTVTPMSNISSIALLNTVGVTDFSALQEKTVRLGYTEGLMILKASLQSKTVLTDVFLSKKRAHCYV